MISQSLFTLFSLSAFRITCLDCSQFGRSQEVEAEPEMEVAEPEMEVAEQVEAPVEATEGSVNKKSKKQKKDQPHLQGMLSNARERNGKLDTFNALDHLSEKKRDAVKQLMWDQYGHRNLCTAWQAGREGGEEGHSV